MSNIYLEVTIETFKTSVHSKLGLKNCHQVSFWGALTHADIIEF